MRLPPFLLMTLCGAVTGGVAAQDLPQFGTAAEAGNADPAITKARVEASGTALTLTLQALLERAPKIVELRVFHSSSTTLELGSLEALAGFTRLEDLTLTGDPFLYDSEFAALGALTRLRSLRMALP